MCITAPSPVRFYAQSPPHLPLATRSLHNTAKVMEDNPIALRRKELETLERVAERIDRISVFGGLDQVFDGRVKLHPQHDPVRRSAAGVFFCPVIAREFASRTSRARPGADGLASPGAPSLARSA